MSASAPIIQLSVARSPVQPATFGAVTTQPDGLISVLLDAAASWSERDDAAMDLVDFDTPEVVEALVSVGSDPTVPDVVLDSVGETLGVFARRRSPLLELEDRLLPEARSAFRAIVEQPGLLPDEQV